MAGLNMIKFAPEPDTSIQNGQIRFYFNESDSRSIYVHFQTPFDEMVMEQMLQAKSNILSNITADEEQTSDKRNIKHRDSSTDSFHTLVRSKFAQVLLFAIQVCHIIILVEPGNIFDTSYLSIFKALKVIR